MRGDSYGKAVATVPGDQHLWKCLRHRCHKRAISPSLVTIDRTSSKCNEGVSKHSNVAKAKRSCFGANSKVLWRNERKAFLCNTLSFPSITDLNKGLRFNSIRRRLFGKINSSSVGR
jgi:hypothetical protein